MLERLKFELEILLSCFLVLVFYYLKRLQLCLSHLVTFSHFPSLTCFLNFHHHKSFNIFSLVENLVLVVLLCALIIIQIFCLHIVVSILLMLYLFLAISILFMLHLLAMSVQFILHCLTMLIQSMFHLLQLFLTQRGKEKQLLMMLQSFPSLLIQYQRNKIMITLGNFKIHGLLNYLG